MPKKKKVIMEQEEVPKDSIIKQKEIPKKNDTIKDSIIKKFQCEICNKWFSSQGALNLHKWSSHGIKGKKREIEEKSVREKGVLDMSETVGEKGYQLATVSRYFKIDANDLALAQLLINSGIATSLPDLFKKGIHLLAFGHVKMPEEKNSEEEDISKKILKGYKDAKIAKVMTNILEEKPEKEKEEAPSEDEIDKAIRELTKQQRWRQVQKMMAGEDFSLKDMMQMQLLQNMLSKSNPNPGESLMVLQQQINQLQNQLRQQELQHRQEMELAQLRSQIEKIAEKKGLSAEDIMKIWAEREKAVKEKDMELQKERDKNLRNLLDLKMKELERQIASVQSSGDLSKLKEISEAIKTIKEVSAEIGERKPDALEYISTIAKNVGPVVRDVAEMTRQQPVAVAPPRIKPATKKLAPPKKEVVEEEK